MSLQLFWRSGGLRSLVTSTASRCQTFSTSHVAKALSLDPVKRGAQQAQYNERARIKRQTDPGYAKRRRAADRDAHSRRSDHNGENRERILGYKREYSKKRYAQDPLFRLRAFMLDCVKMRVWFREDLPWKSHVPLWYEEKVQNTCSGCTVTRHGGGRLWWKQRSSIDDEQSTDDKQSADIKQEQGQEDEKYLCHKCYVTGPEAMPEGYEDCSNISDLKARMRELGH